MKIYLDDIRSAPKGWIRVYWPEEVIEYLKNVGLSLPFPDGFLPRPTLKRPTY